MRYKAVLFDLDGTLLNTIEDLADAMNTSLASLHMPKLTIKQCKSMVGEGREAFAREALPENERDAQTIKQCVQLMTQAYSKNWAEKTRPYDGVVEMLAALAEVPVKLAVLSNKYDESVKQAVAHFFKADSFALVRGALDGVPRKPDPTSALQMAGELDCVPGDVLYLGDTDTDMQTAVSAGMFAVGALWGFRSAEELADNGASALIGSPMELLGLL